MSDHWQGARTLASSPTSQRVEDTRRIRAGA